LLGYVRVLVASSPLCKQIGLMGKMKLKCLKIIPSLISDISDSAVPTLSTPSDMSLLSAI